MTKIVLFSKPKMLVIFSFEKVIKIKRVVFKSKQSN